jgi:hypothetical protein
MSVVITKYVAKENIKISSHRFKKGEKVILLFHSERVMGQFSSSMSLLGSDLKIIESLTPDQYHMALVDLIFDDYITSPC